MLNICTVSYTMFYHTNALFIFLMVAFASLLGSCMSCVGLAQNHLMGKSRSYQEIGLHFIETTSVSHGHYQVNSYESTFHMNLDVPLLHVTVAKRCQREHLPRALSWYRLESECMD